MSEEFSSALPKLYVPFLHNPYSEVLFFRQRWVPAILAVGGWTIHDLVASSKVKAVVLEAWRVWKSLEREQTEKHEKGWRDYLMWLRRMGCPVDIGRLLEEAPLARVW